MSPPVGVSLWLLSPGAADAQKGLPSVVQLLPLLRWLRAAVFKVGGQGHSWGWAQGLELVFIPKARQTERYLALVLFFFGAWGGYWILLPSK